ncbi:MAG: hypothetical protein ACKVG0_02905, partial [Alphaproteobacteria bacterium]
AVAEPATNWWQEYGLGSPEALIKVFVNRSGCFTLVDRGRGLDLAQQERALASGGDLRVGSNVGAGQVLAADYILLPDLVSSNSNAGGGNVGGILGGLIGGAAGAIVAGVNIRDMTADVTLTVTDVRSTMPKSARSSPWRICKPMQNSWTRWAASRRLAAWPMRRSKQLG